MASARTLAVLLLAMLAVAHGCPTPQCTGGLEPVWDSGTKCGYNCCSPCKPQCLYPLSKPYCCAGTTGVRCPVIACTTSYSTAISGPGGCAKAASAITARAFSKTDVESNIKPLWEKDIDQCATYDPIDITSRWANAYAFAVAYTLINFWEYACTCCVGNNYAYSSVSANVQSVAAACAHAAQEVLVLSSCNGVLMSGASTQLDALAADTQLAIDKVFKDVVSSNGFCDKDEVRRRVQYAIAEAAACTFFDIVLTYYDPDPSVYNCGTTKAISGPGAIWTANCKVSGKLACPGP